MKLEDLEKKFGDYVNSKEDTDAGIDSDNLHGSEVWAGIKDRITPEKSIGEYWWAVASIIVAIAMFSIFYSFNISQKNRVIARLETELTDLKKSENNLTEQVKQMQFKIDMVQNNVPENRTTEIKVEERNLNLPVTQLKKVYPLKPNTDSINNISMTEKINVEDFLVENEKKNLPDSTIYDEFRTSEKDLVSSVPTETFKKGLAHYKIYYGDMESNNDTLHRSWKLAITYK